MLGVLEGFTIIGVVVAVGYILARVEILPSNAGVVLNRFAFFVALPALMFGTLYRADLSIVFSSRLPVAAISFCVVALLYTVIFGVVLRRGIARTVLGATGSGMVNANNMGLPVATYIFGDPAQVAPILLFQLVFLTPVLLAVLDITSRGEVQPQGRRHSAFAESAGHRILAWRGLQRAERSSAGYRAGTVASDWRGGYPAYSDCFWYVSAR